MSEPLIAPSHGIERVVGWVVTSLLLAGPVVGVALAVPLLWGHAMHLLDIVLGLVLYVVFGFGVTAGFHRLFTHRGFAAARGLKIALAVAGSMAVEGSVVSWVANHRRHHMLSDHEGDPHSPHVGANGALSPWRGFLHAHVGWLFSGESTSVERFAPDMLRDRDLVLIGRLFPLLAVASLALPFLIGWAWSQSLAGGVTSLVWAGLVRMALFHHVTWSVNSICHLMGRRPFATTDRSANVAALAVSLGESWHNLHHAYPISARHGALPGQVDPSARVIRIFERLGWATQVRWPAAERLASLAVEEEPLPLAA